MIKLLQAKEGLSFGSCLAVSVSVHALAIYALGGVAGGYTADMQVGAMVVNVEIVADPGGPAYQAVVAEQPEDEVVSIRELKLDTAALRARPVTAPSPAKPRIRQQSPMASVKPAVLTQDIGAGSAAGLPSQQMGFGLFGPGHAPARVGRAPIPPYPMAARLAGFEGKLILGVAIAATGLVQDVQLLASSGRTDCDESAIKTVRNDWRFLPAKLNGSPVDSREKVVIRYDLR